MNPQNTMVEPDFPEKIILLSYGRSPSPSYHLYLAIMYIVIYKRLVLVFWSIEIDWGWFLSVLYKYELWCVSLPDTPPLKDRFLWASHDLQRLQKLLSWGFLNHLNMMVEPDFLEKIILLSYGRSPSPSYHLYLAIIYIVIYKRLVLVFWSIEIDWGWFLSVLYKYELWCVSLPDTPPSKIDFYRLPMTCKDSKSFCPGGFWTLWTQWSSQISLKKSYSWVMVGPPPPPKCYIL